MFVILSALIMLVISVAVGGLRINYDIDSWLEPLAQLMIFLFEISLSLN